MITLPKTKMTISIARKNGVWETTLILGGPILGAVLVLEDFLEKKEILSHFFTQHYSTIASDAAWGGQVERTLKKCPTA